MPLEVKSSNYFEHPATVTVDVAYSGESSLGNLLGGEAALARCRKPEIVADAAWEILTRSSRECTGQFFIDEDVLRESGVADFELYAVSPGTPLMPDFFLGEPDFDNLRQMLHG